MTYSRLSAPLSPPQSSLPNISFKTTNAAVGTRHFDAHRGDGKRFVVHADEKLTAFIVAPLNRTACLSFTAFSERARRGGSHGQVWVNTETGVYHREGSRFYGTTRKGKYMDRAGRNPSGIQTRAQGTIGDTGLSKNSVRAFEDRHVLDAFSTVLVERSGLLTMNQHGDLVLPPLRTVEPGAVAAR
jgi:hypothetical protein